MESVKVSNTEGLHDRAEKALKANAGYRYNPNTLKEVIEKGEVPVGAKVVTMGGNDIYHTGGGALEARNEKGEVVKSIPAGGMPSDQILIEYAKSEAKAAVYK